MGRASPRAALCAIGRKSSLTLLFRYWRSEIHRLRVGIWLRGRRILELLREVDNSLVYRFDLRELPMMYLIGLFFLLVIGYLGLLYSIAGSVRASDAKAYEEIGGLQPSDLWIWGFTRDDGFLKRVERRFSGTNEYGAVRAKVRAAKACWILMLAMPVAAFFVVAAT